VRFIIRVKIPTEAGNKMVLDPNLLRKLEEYINKVKAEAAYFFEADDNRVAAFIVDVQSADQIPVLAEPLFNGMGANVEFHPVMSLDDLKREYHKPYLKLTHTVTENIIFFLHLLLAFLYHRLRILLISTVMLHKLLR
jgi:hypothetical protein